VGIGGIISATLDAGPTIHLWEIGELSLLTVFDKLMIPETVWDETVGRGRVPEKALESLPNLMRVNVASDVAAEFIREMNLADIHKGEAECLYWCVKEKVALILTDDLAVRDAAKALNIRPVGSLGVVIRAFRDKKITLEAARKILFCLYRNSTLFVSWTIVEMAIEQLEK